MTKSQHTPGPWEMAGVRVKLGGADWHSIYRYDEAKKEEENIALVGFDRQTGLGFADARLIAAAPELLMALQLAMPALEWCERQWEKSPQRGSGIDVMAVVRAAIAKAEGADQ